MKTWITFSMLAFLTLPAVGVTITDGSNQANNRFSSGFPTAPINNTDSSFVGLGYDFSSGGWASSPVSKGFGFLSPQHYLVARHFGGAGTVVLSAGDGTTLAGTQRGVTATTFGVVFPGQSVGDLSIGALNSPFSSSYPLYRSGVLDLNSASGTNTPTAYNGLNVFLYAGVKNTTTSPKVGVATINGVTVSGQNHLFTTNRDDVQLQDGDSGSPAFYGWTNPNGEKDLLTIGNNAGINDTTNFMNFTGTFQVMNALNATMTGDGFALRVEGNSSHTWSGANSQNINSNPNWGIGGNPGGTGGSSDTFVLFDAQNTSESSIVVNTNYELRGLYFRETASTTDGFTFEGTNTLTVGRGGITNYDGARQVFNAPLALGDHQYWDVGAGGVTVTNLNTNGRLLEVAGAGTARFNGAITGSGGLAVSGARVELEGTNSYTGNTWVHAGVLNVGGSIQSSSPILLGTHARLEGSGTVGAISGSGRIDPGNSPGILTATSVDPSGGIDFHFEFTNTGSPDYTNASASVNDVLRLTGATPFTANLSASNEIHMYLELSSLSLTDTFRGGFYTDNSADFLSAISDANFFWYLENASGDTEYNEISYSLYTGPFTFDLSTVDEFANFGNGTIDGQVMQFVVIPELGTIFLSLILLSTFGLLSISRKRKSN